MIEQKISNAKDRFEWIDVASPTNVELEALSARLQLHTHALQDCMEPDHLPKFEHLDDFDFIIVRIYASEATQAVHTTQEVTNKIAIFYNDRQIVTVHRKPFRFLEALKQGHEDVLNCHSSREVVSKLIWHSIHSFEKPALVLSEEIDKIESVIFLKAIQPSQLERFYFLKRQASLCKKVLLQTQEVLSRHRSTPADAGTLQDTRDLHLKLVSLFDQAQEDVNNLSNIYLSLSAQKTNDVMKVLTIFSAFFMPLTFIAGIYGMNFENMPELKLKYGYFATWAFMLLIAVVIYVWFKRRKLI